MAEYALTEIGNYDVLMCESGSQALEKIEAYMPDLILVDLRMPELDGTETITKIRKIPMLKDTPAIFITAEIVPPEIAELMSHDGAVIGLIHKPIVPEELGKVVQSLWNSHSS